MTQRPNIVLINADDLGYGDLGCYGSMRNDTPHLDRLAAEGVRLTDFYMASPVCSPSRGGMLTGCYPPRIGFGEFVGRPVLFPGDPVGLDPAERTMARVLGDAGYATAAIGKWHCGDQPEFLPTRHGFDSYFGIPFSNDMGRQREHEDWPPLPLMSGESVVQEQPDQRSLTERYTVAATRFIEENAHQPFFLYLAHMYVHVPLFVPAPFLAASRNGGYGGAVAALDWSTGVVMDTLRRLGLEENTIVVFTSDNGSRARGEGGSNDPLRGHKAQTWEGGQRVACVVRWPAAIPAGGVCDAVTRSIDLLPTFAAVAGAADWADPARPVDGVDLTALLTGAGPAPNETFAYYYMDDLEAVRVGDWKLHLSKRRDPMRELYDLRTDAAETHDVAADHPDVVARLEAVAETIRADLGDARLGVVGAGRRPQGRVEDAQPLTSYREDHPYLVAMYDLPDMPTMAG
ncbi:Cerebroside-sulfatase [Beutenbergia cavernae DSM 12333]|uniref:Cerebroside-sulfatase n=1 Tax=Beutenbergia cavernae (strain ATCC BAA-8 / DSM 12333 / CCUG 43141 / JCM 11478 / NBRC 16432 / NCIMB 13614 / HKI 0122) TaxID=471853 RepID=C5C581_BEUC1|nr:sulfatase [Beutenbergia cavernae]ACQ82221.1 Cerebroside-sulfatase [Beutenbergia cavernae DSM 12333]